MAQDQQVTRAGICQPKQGSESNFLPYFEWKRLGCLRTTAGASVDYEHVAREVVDIIADVQLQAIAFDRWRVELMRKEFDRLGVVLPLVDWGLGFEDMSPAIGARKPSC